MEVEVCVPTYKAERVASVEEARVGDLLHDVAGLVGLDHLHVLPVVGRDADQQQTDGTRHEQHHRDQQHSVPEHTHLYSTLLTHVRHFTAAPGLI